jgi:hypothetical protein
MVTGRDLSAYNKNSTRGKPQRWQLDSGMPSMNNDSSPKGPSRTTVKRLFALSGNRCAGEDCENPLVDPKFGTLIGKVCHIKGDKPSAKRFDSTQTDAERHDFANLILLCPSCHDIIDSDEEWFTVPKLIEMKEQHERRLHGSPALEPSDELADDLTCSRASRLHVVDIGVIEEKGQYPLLDIKVLNLGDSPIYVYEAVFKVLRSLQFAERRNRYKARPVSWVYDLELRPEPFPYDEVLSISQVIPANDGDRFQVRIGNEEIVFVVRETLYQIQVALVCSDSNDLTFSEPVLISVPMPKSVHGMRSVPDPVGDQANRDAVAEFVSLPGKKSGRIRELEAKLLANERL